MNFMPCVRRASCLPKRDWKSWLVPAQRSRDSDAFVTRRGVEGRTAFDGVGATRFGAIDAVGRRSRDIRY
jgi:hypothetical protein